MKFCFLYIAQPHLPPQHSSCQCVTWTLFKFAFMRHNEKTLPLTPPRQVNALPSVLIISFPNIGITFCLALRQQWCLSVTMKVDLLTQIGWRSSFHQNANMDQSAGQKGRLNKENRLAERSIRVIYTASHC